MGESQTFSAAADAVISGQSRRVSIPRRFQTPMREVWMLQERLIKRAPRRSIRLLQHPRFRAAYDFLLLRAEAGDVDPELASWWTELIHSDDEAREKIVDRLSRGRRQFKRRRKPKS